MPELGSPEHYFPLRLRGDLAVRLCRGIDGRADVKQLDFYRLSNGLWLHVGSSVLHSNYSPSSFECEDRRVRVHAIGGRKLADIQLP